MTCLTVLFAKYHMATKNKLNNSTWGCHTIYHKRHNVWTEHRRMSKNYSEREGRGRKSEHWEKYKQKVPRVRAYGVFADVII